jgi:hypothetical protein
VFLLWTDRLDLSGKVDRLLVVRWSLLGFLQLCERVVSEGFLRLIEDSDKVLVLHLLDELLVGILWFGLLDVA